MQGAEPLANHRQQADDEGSLDQANRQAGHSVQQPERATPDQWGYQRAQAGRRHEQDQREADVYHHQPGVVALAPPDRSAELAVQAAIQPQRQPQAQQETALTQEAAPRGVRHEQQEDQPQRQLRKAHGPPRDVPRSTANHAKPGPWNPPRQRSTAWPGRVSPPDHKPVGPVAPRPTIRLAMEQSTIQADPRRAWLALSTAIGLAVIAAWLVLGGGIDRF